MIQAFQNSNLILEMAKIFVFTWESHLVNTSIFAILINLKRNGGEDMEFILKKVNADGIRSLANLGMKETGLEVFQVISGHHKLVFYMFSRTPLQSALASC
ncbi:hypothetical protein OIU78_025656 [Salix suchowensis]|nr:hypothetical protein OIU78_025656 [Salix suchowensis]